ncbi:MAG: ABC transporter substrate-binding protein [Tissierellia bacterium]|nr:ABC transporter substrate-binding protein [Tissierellia bacterium]
MRRKRFLSFFLVMLLVLPTLFSCGKSEDTVVIGYIGDLSGEDAYVGVPPQLFLKDYFEQLNKEGGILGKQVKFVAYDMQPDNAVDGSLAANRLINEDKAIAIIGPSSSSAAIPMAEICGQAKVPFIATSATNEKVTIAEDGSLNSYAFRVCFIDSYQGTAAANFAYDKGIRKVGMIETLGNPYSQNICDFFAEQFELLGGEVVSRIGVQAQDVEFRAQLTNFGSAGIDALFFPSGTYKLPSLVANQAADLNLDFKYIFTDGVYDDTLLEVAGPNIEGAIMTNYLFGDDPAYDEFRDEYNAKHKEYSANIFVYLAYDAVELLMHAIKESNSLDPVEIQKALENATDVELFTDKHFTVDPKTHNPLNKMVAIIGVEDGKFTLIENYYPTE